MTIEILPLLLLALAASRATHLVSDDLFPFGALRDRLDRSENGLAHWLSHGLGCTFCVSVHAGFWSALLALGLGWLDLPGDSLEALGAFAVVWFALAQAVVLIELAVFRLLGDE